MNLAADLGKSLPHPLPPGFRSLTWQVRRLDLVMHTFPSHSVALGPCTSLDDTKSPIRCSKASAVSAIAPWAQHGVKGFSPLKTWTSPKPPSDAPGGLA